MWIPQIGIISKDFEESISYFLSGGAEIRILTDHCPDQAHYVGNCAESIIIHVKSGIVEYLHPTVNFIDVSMERRICPGSVHATSAFCLLLGGTVLCKVVCLFLYHKSEDIEINAAQGKYIRFLGCWKYRWGF